MSTSRGARGQGRGSSMSVGFIVWELCLYNIFCQFINGEIFHRICENFNLVSLEEQLGDHQNDSSSADHKSLEEITWESIQYFHSTKRNNMLCNYIPLYSIYIYTEQVGTMKMMGKNDWFLLFFPQVTGMLCHCLSLIITIFMFLSPICCVF